VPPPHGCFGARWARTSLEPGDALGDDSAMSTDKATLRWVRNTPDFSYETYDRAHEVVYGSGVSLPATAGVSFGGKPDRVNPEEQLLGALASCHLLTFLAYCAKKRYVLDSYEDTPTATLGKNADGKTAVEEIVLRPKVVFSGDRIPDQEEIVRLHARAHDDCFIANSVKARVVVVPC
jgi:organic hydroperoxide reductase OsmC/OhrA